MGDRSTAAVANFDTFAFTNAAPQAAGFNQGANLWLGLEDYILTQAESFDQRLCVFTAPVLDLQDPIYRTVQIPRRFWKIAAWNAGTDTSPRLAATGYILDQTPQLDDLDTVTNQALAAGEPPPLGPYRTYQVPIIDTETLTQLDLPQLAAADRISAGEPVPAARLRRDSATIADWHHLNSYLTIQL